MTATMGEPSRPAPRDTGVAWSTACVNLQDATACVPCSMDATAYAVPLTAPQDVHQLVASVPASPIPVAPVSAAAATGSRNAEADAPQVWHRVPSRVAADMEPASSTAAAPLHRDVECAERFFIVDIRKQPEKSLGLTIYYGPSGMIIYKVYDKDKNDNETHICEWNRACRATYPQEVVKPLDRIVRVNNVRPEPRPGSACCEQMRAQIIFQTDLLLLIARPDCVEI